MAIFVTGATGYLGNAVARALATAAFEVRGLARDDAGAARLARDEIEPVPGALDDVEVLERAGATHEATVFAAVQKGPARWTLERAALAAIVEGARAARRPRLLVYTSGVWVYGATGDDAVDEASPLRPPAEVVERLAAEAFVLEAAGGNLTTAIVRPGCVYGGPGGITAPWFASASASPTHAARVIGDGTARWAMIHRADLAALYRRVIETHASGVWNAVDGARDSVGACAAAASLACGGRGEVEHVAVEEVRAATGAIADCLVLDQHVSAAKARDRLGWTPAHAGFVAEARRLALAWRAHA